MSDYYSIIACEISYGSKAIWVSFIISFISSRIMFVYNAIALSMA